MAVTPSFIENVNSIAKNLIAIIYAGELFDDTSAALLEELAVLDITLLTEDLKKGNYLGNRKIDINLTLNNLSDTTHVSYSNALLVLNDGMQIDIPFEVINEDLSTSVLEFTSHADIKNYIVTHQLFIDNATNTEVTVEDEIGDNPQIIRFRDSDGFASNIDRVVLSAYSGQFADSKPSYFWAKTTSSLQTLANRAGDIIALGNDIDSIIALASKVDEIAYLYADRNKLTGATDSLYSELAKFQAIYTELTGLTAVYDDIKIGGNNYTKTVALDLSNVDSKIDTIVTNLTIISDVKNSLPSITGVHTNKINIDDVSNNLAYIQSIVANLTAIQNASANASSALASKNTSANNATLTALDVVSTHADVVDSANNAQIAKTKSDAITTMTTSATTVVAGTPSNADFNPITGVMKFDIPEGEQGAKGDRGDAFVVGATGTLVGRVAYDGASKDFSYVATDEGMIYFKKSDTSGDWNAGSPFGKGDTGNGIDNVALIAGTHVSGTLDTYRMTFTDGSFFDYQVYNGADGDLLGANNLSDLADLATARTNLSVYSKAESDVSLALKSNKSDIQNNLLSIATDKSLSANQGKVLKDLIDNINTLLSSDDTALDQFQELVNAIKVNKGLIDNMAIANVLGLTTALNLKLNASLVLTPVPLGALFTDTTYTHPTTDGNKHIPAGGEIGQMIVNTASGTGAWQDQPVQKSLLFEKSLFGGI